MEIHFDNRKLEKTCRSAKDLTKAYGAVCGKLIERRLQEMEAAKSLAMLMTLPQARCHELTGDRDGQFAVSLEHPRRLVFEPAHDPLPKKADGGLDLTSVTAVRILEVVDYHGN